MTAENGGRITTREFYDALLDCTKEMGKMELRIIEKINGGITSQQEYRIQTDARLAAGTVRFENLDVDVKNLKLWDRGIGILSLVGAAIAAAIGIDK